MSSRATRDLGLERIGRSTRYLAVGSLLAAGIASAAVAKALPGHATRPSTTGSVSSPAGQTQSGQSQPAGGAISPSTSPSSGGLSAPAQAPQPSYSAPVVSSGGS